MGGVGGGDDGGGEVLGFWGFGVLETGGMWGIFAVLRRSGRGRWRRGRVRVRVGRMRPRRFRQGSCVLQNVIKLVAPENVSR